VRSGMREVLVLIESGNFRPAKQLLGRLGRLRRQLESKNIEAEYRAVELAYHYYTRSRRSVIKRSLKRCEDAVGDASDVPVLLMIERMIFRAQTRIGDFKGAIKTFNTHLRRIKRILSNMPDEDYVFDFLNDRDELLVREEYKLIKRQKKGARQCRAP
ncbi:MAG: hypothetical protein KAJ17_01360, partial [Candidatus Krumholzibacteria bacterium]|nr:hypothetical protein [Candidatus Krumholzibacteria bacterium]